MGSLGVWDMRVARAAALATFFAFALALAITSLTDEGGVAIAERVARTLGALPICAAFGAWLALTGRRGRGELRTLETLGQSPARAALPAAVGAFAVALLLGASVTASPSFDEGAFFPATRVIAPLRWTGDAFVDESGLRVTLDGKMVKPAAPLAAGEGREAGASSTSRRPGGRAVIALATLLASAALALFGAGRWETPREMAAGALATLAAAAATIGAFHLAAIGRAPLVSCVVAPIALFVFAVIRYGGAPWEKS